MPHRSVLSLVPFLNLLCTDLTATNYILQHLTTDGRRCTDLFVGYTDRAVGAYRWNSNANSLIALTDRLPLNGQVKMKLPTDAMP